MKDSETRRLEMLRRVRDFGATHAAQFAAGTKGNTLFTALQDEIRGLEESAAAQASGKSTAQQGTGNREDARQSLYRQLKAISQTARSMAFETHGLDDKFRMPRGSNDQIMLNTARAFATDARPLKAQFIQYEMPATFLEDLDAAITDFEDAITRQNEGQQSALNSTASLGVSTETGVAIVRQLDAIVRNKFREDRATLEAWKSVTHIERAPKGKATEPKHEPPSPPAKPSS
jgi:hypothetical protein